MNIAWDELIAMAATIDPEDSESLSKLFIDLLQKEHAARHKKRNNLISDFSSMIDNEQGVIK